jgi:multiple antibiotic resistance protein
MTVHNAVTNTLYPAIDELVRASLFIVGALFPIVNAPDNIPVFLILTRGLSANSRAVMARKIGIYSFVLLVVSVLIGTHILAFFGISIPVVQVGGGLVVIAVGWRLLNPPDNGYSGEAERSFRREAERHSGMIPNTIGA